MSSENHGTVIIGCGPAGLAMAGQLARVGVDYVVLERSERVADAWHRHYERLHLHTVKSTSHLPFAPFDGSYPRYIPRRELVDYYTEYAENLGLAPRLGVSVARISKEGDAWVTTSAQGETFESRHVVVCTGFNRVPVVPTWEGQETYPGVVVHSREYTSGEIYRDLEVLVVGMGNTGAEVALDLLERGARPTISVRGPVNLVPREILGRPTQLTAMLLAKLPNRVGDALGVFLRKMTVGDLSRWGLETPEMPPTAQLRELGKTPVIDVGTLREIKAGLIAVRPAIERFEGAEVAFVDGRRSTPDAIVLATGYRPAVEEIVPEVRPFLNEHGVPRGPSADGELEGLHFLGFDAYATGGILKSIRDQSAEILGRIIDTRG